MASSTFSDPSTEDNSAAKNSFTIVINENGEIDYDPSALQDIIDSHQSLAPVTLVRLGASPTGTAPPPTTEGIATRRSTRTATTLVSKATTNEATIASKLTTDDANDSDDLASVQMTVDSHELSLVTQPANPILLLDQDQITRLENVLKSDEAKDMLGEALDPSGSDFGAGLIDMLSGAPSVLDSVGLSGDASETSDSKGGQSESESDASQNLGRRRKAPERRSQRQMEREMKEEAEKIRKENQEIMKKELEVAQKEPEDPEIETETDSINFEFDSQMSDDVASTGAVLAETDQVISDQIMDTSEADLSLTEVADEAVVEEDVQAEPVISARKKPGRRKKAVMIPVLGTDTVGSRPKRQRKLPARMQNQDFEYGFGPAMAAELEATKPEEEKPATGPKKRGPPKRKLTAAAARKAAKTAENEQGESSEIKDEIDAEPVDADTDEDEEIASDDDWESEDDPERLWCICQKPHDNKFMIACDNCKGWFHGRCVGITKKMGHDMEVKKILWTCPSCKSGKAPSHAKETKMDVEEEFDDEKLNGTGVNDEKKSLESATSLTTPPGSAVKKKRQKKAPGRRKKREVHKEEEKKPKVKVCFECDKVPMEHSIFCSETCIIKHANKAKDRIEQNRPKNNKSSPSAPKTLPRSDSTSLDGTKNHLLVMEPSTNTMLSGPNAPTEASLEEWLKDHPTFHVVMPSAMPTSRFYGFIKPEQRDKTGTKTSLPLKPVSANIAEEKLAAYEAAKSSALSGLQAARKHLEEAGETVTPKNVKRSISNNSATGEKEVRKRRRKMSESHRKDATSTTMTSPSSVSSSNQFDPKPIRANATKGIKEALRIRLTKVNDMKMEPEDLDTLSSEIEDQMFNLYQRDIGPKYKAKYRSLIFNIKDEKNNGLYRKIVNGIIKPKDLVAMTAEEMASKELQQWRQAELKHDIDKIKSHELEMISLGSVFVMKTKKGEQVIEKDDLPSSSKISSDTKLPDEMPNNDVPQTHSVEGAKTWEHGHHAGLFDSLCDVCTGKKTLDEFLLAKIDRRRRKEKEERRRKEKERSKSKDHSRHDKSSRHSSDRSSKEKESSSHRDRSIKEKESSSQRDRSPKEKEISLHRERSSKESSSSSRDRHKHSSSSSSHHRRKSDSKESSSSSRHLSSSSHHHRHLSSSSHKSKDSTKSSTSSYHIDKQKVEEKQSATLPSVTKLPSEKSISSELPTASTYLPSTSLLSKSDSKTSISAIEEYIPSVVSSYPPLPPVGDVTDILEEEIPRPISPEEENEFAPVSPPDDVVDQEIEESPKISMPDSEVTSTVSIKTPEQNLVEANPVVWKGDINMPDVAKFSVMAHQVSGTTDYLTIDLKESLKIVGRISPDQVWDYISKIRESTTKEILVIELRPSSNDQQSSYDAFYDYLKNRKRFGVIGITNCKMVKDCYIIPLAASEDLHSCLMPLDGPGLDEAREDALLSLIVRTRRKRPGDEERDRLLESSKAELPASKSSKVELPATTKTVSSNVSKIRKSSTEKPSPSHKIKVVLDMDDMPYDPESVGYDPESAGKAGDLGSISSSDSEEVYDPESAFLDKPSKKEKKVEREKAQQQQEVVVKTELPVIKSLQSEKQAKLSEDVAKLTRELEAQKLKLKETKKKLPIPKTEDPEETTSVPGQKGLPSGIANILFRSSESNSPTETATKPGNGSNQARDPRKRPGPAPTTSATAAAEKSSTLATLSDEDLLARAAEELADLSKQGPSAPEPAKVIPPPAFTVMPPFPPLSMVPINPHLPPPTVHEMIPPPPKISMRPPGPLKPPPSGAPWARGYEPRGSEQSERVAPRGDWQQRQGDRNWNRRDDDDRRGNSATWNDRGNRNANWNDRRERRDDRHRSREDDYDRRGGYDRKQHGHNRRHDDDRRGGGRN